MLILVSGGSASGKSEFAEGLVTASGLETRAYLATMQVWDCPSIIGLRPVAIRIAPPWSAR